MEVKIGVQYAQRELVLESAQTPAEVEQAVTEAMAKDSVLTLTDEKGRKVIVPIAKVRGAMLATPDNKERVKGAVRAYFDFMDHESEAFRLVFESDLRNDPQVRERVERVEQGCIAAVTDTVVSDTGQNQANAELLASGLVGAAGQAAQYWLASGRQTPKAEAEALVAALIWRGIASFPLQGESTPGTSGEIG